MTDIVTEPAVEAAPVPPPSTAGSSRAAELAEGQAAPEQPVDGPPGSEGEDDAEPTDKACTGCGASLPIGAGFCGACGARQEVRDPRLDMLDPRVVVQYSTEYSADPQFNLSQTIVDFVGSGAHELRGTSVDKVYAESASAGQGLSFPSK